jgi:hypothetical protein
MLELRGGELLKVNISFENAPTNSSNPTAFSMPVMLICWFNSRCRLHQAALFCVK